MNSRTIRLLILPVFLIFAFSLSIAPSFATEGNGDIIIIVEGPVEIDGPSSPGDYLLTCEQLLSTPVASFGEPIYTVAPGVLPGAGESTVQVFLFDIDLQAGERVLFRFSGAGAVFGDISPADDTDEIDESKTLGTVSAGNPVIFFNPTAGSDGRYNIVVVGAEDILIEVIDCGFPAACARGYPVLGQIMVTGDLEGYGQPGQDRISGLNVFNDANNDGFDTFDIQDIVNDEDGNPAWYGIFLGGCDPVYVDASLVTRIR